MTDAMEAAKRAVCPKIKAYLADNQEEASAARCDCQPVVKTAYGCGQTLCSAMADEVARDAVIAFLRVWADGWEDETAAEIRAEADRLERGNG